VGLHLKQLRSLQIKTPSAIDKSLDSLPTTIEAVYDQIFRRFDQQAETDRKTSRLVLMWLCYSVIPRVSFYDLADASIVDWQHGTLNEGERPADPHNFVSVCGNLIVVSGDLQLRFIHASVQQYIQKHSHEVDVLSAPSRTFQIPNESQARLEIALTCLGYLLSTTRPVRWSDVRDSIDEEDNFGQTQREFPVLVDWLIRLVFIPVPDLKRSLARHAFEQWYVYVGSTSSLLPDSGHLKRLLDVFERDGYFTQWALFHDGGLKWDSGLSGLQKLWKQVETIVSAVEAVAKFRGVPSNSCISVCWNS